MSGLSHVKFISMAKRSVLFSVLSILIVGYFNFHTVNSVATASMNSSDSVFANQTIGVQSNQINKAIISSNQIIPMIKKYRFIVSPF